MKISKKGSGIQSFTQAVNSRSARLGSAADTRLPEIVDGRVGVLGRFDPGTPVAEVLRRAGLDNRRGTAQDRANP
jgi:hypothetical protein